MVLENAIRSLEGLSVGDGYGETRGRMLFSGHSSDELPPAPWRWTDDTSMAISVVEILRDFGEIDQSSLAVNFASRFIMEPNRGYAGQAMAVLQSIADGEDWRMAAVSNYPDGSYGNGAAMRAAPIGAFFAGDPPRAAEQAALSAEITHAHPEGKAGGIAVSVAAAINAADPELSPTEFIDSVANHTPDGRTRDRMLKAKDFGPEDVVEASLELGNGSYVAAFDTVPFCMFIASHYRQSFVPAMMQTAMVGGDMDTNCAIVGGILASGSSDPPEDWVSRREPLPAIVVPG